jgi:hypothetical protein
MATIIGNKLVSDSIVFYVDFSNRKCFPQNILNYSSWTLGSGTIQTDITKSGVTYYNQISQDNENLRVLSNDPFGYTNSVVWKSSSMDDVTPPDSTHGDGGFDTGIFRIDPDMKYRFTIWTKRDSMTSGSASGQFYLGFHAIDGNSTLPVQNKSSLSEIGNNPYFHVVPPTYLPTSNPSQVSPPFLGGLDTWTLVVGHVWERNSEVKSTLPGTNINNLPSDGNHPDSGVWTKTSGKIGNLSIKGDWIWNENSTFGLHRSYHFYASDTMATQSFIYPRVDIIDGFEPTIKELLSGPEPIRDLSPNLNVIYPYSTTSLDPQRKGLMFSGVEREIVGGPISKTFSINSASIWFQPKTTIDSSTNGQTLVQFGNSNQQPFTILLGSHSNDLTNEVITINWDNTRYTCATSSITLSGDVWYNLVINWTGVSYQLYLNGVLQTSFSGGVDHAPLKQSVGYISIGGSKFTSSTGRYFQGKIGSILTYSRELTDAEILSNYRTMSVKYIN